MSEHVNQSDQGPLLSICQGCGITNKDGAPDLGIPFPRVIAREEVDNQILCDECLAQETREVPSTREEQDAIVSAYFGEIEKNANWEPLNTPLSELWNLIRIPDSMVGLREKALRGWIRRRVLTLEKRWPAPADVSRQLALLPPSQQMELVKSDLLKMQFQVGRQAMDHCSVSNRVLSKNEDGEQVVEFVVRARVLQLD